MFVCLTPVVYDGSEGEPLYIPAQNIMMFHEMPESSTINLRVKLIDGTWLEVADERNDLMSRWPHEPRPIIRAQALGRHNGL